MGLCGHYNLKLSNGLPIFEKRHKILIHSGYTYKKQEFLKEEEKVFDQAEPIFVFRLPKMS